MRNAYLNFCWNDPAIVTMSYSRMVLLAALTMFTGADETFPREDLDGDFIWLDEWQKNTSSAPDNRTRLEIEAYFHGKSDDYEDEEQYIDAEAFRRALTMAVKDVNAHQHAFPFFYLDCNFNGENVTSRSQVLKEIIQDVKAKATTAAYIDAGPASFSVMMALALQLRNITHLSTTASSSFLSMHQFSPFSSRMEPSRPYYVLPLFELLPLLAWKGLAMLYDRIYFNSFAENSFRNSFQMLNISVWKRKVSALEDLTEVLIELKASNKYVVMGVFSEYLARKVLCASIKIGIPVDSFLWIFLSRRFSEKWWLVSDQNCTQKEMENVVEGSLDIDVVVSDHTGAAGISGQTVSQFQARYQDRGDNQTAAWMSRVPQVYDSVWVLALALNKTLQTQQLLHSDHNLDTSNLTPTLRSISFMGLRGPVGFQDTGEPLSLAFIDQIQNGVKKRVGLYNPFKKGGKFLSLKSFKSFGTKVLNNIPYSRRKAVIKVSELVYIIFCLLATLGLVVCFGMLIFNVVLWNDPVFSASTPRLHNLLIVGCAILYTCIFIKHTSGEHGEKGCQAFASLFVIGFSLVLGSLLAKAWLMHNIFMNTLNQEVVSKEQCLANIVVVLAAVQILLAVASFYIDPPFLSQAYCITRRIEFEDRYFCEHHCTSRYEFFHVIVEAALFLPMEMITLFLAWEASYIPGNANAFVIAACTCNNFGLTLVYGVVTAILKKGQDLKFSAYSTIIILFASSNLGFNFGPLIKGFYKNLKNLKQV